MTRGAARDSSCARFGSPVSASKKARRADSSSARTRSVMSWPEESTPTTSPALVAQQRSLPGDRAPLARARDDVALVVGRTASSPRTSALRSGAARAARSSSGDDDVVEPVRADQLAARVAEQLAAVAVEQVDRPVGVAGRAGRAGDVEVATARGRARDSRTVIVDQHALRRAGRPRAAIVSTVPHPDDAAVGCDQPVLAVAGAVAVASRLAALARPGTRSRLAGRSAPPHGSGPRPNALVGGPAGEVLERGVDVDERVGVRHAHRDPRHRAPPAPVEQVAESVDREPERSSRGTVASERAPGIGPRAQPTYAASSTSDLAHAARRRGPPRAARERAHQPPGGLVVAEHRGGEAADAAARAASASARASARPRPWPCHGSPTTIAISAVCGRSGRRTQRATADELVRIVLQHRDERDVVDAVDLGQVAQLGAREARLGGEEALADALVAELAAGRREPVLVAGARSGGSGRRVPPGSVYSTVSYLQPTHALHLRHAR